MTVEVESRKSRGLTRKQEALRRQAVHERARDGLLKIMKDMDGADGEFVIDVLRAVVRSAGNLLVQRAGMARAVGVLVGVLTNICPAWKSERAEAQEAAEAVFRKEPAP